VLRWLFQARITGTWEIVPKIEETGYATMQVGDCFCMVGGLYHAGGHNSTKGQKRPTHDLLFCRGYLRQEVYSRLLSLFG
jgi:ectoine hydroxylase-related dioxygenase (phytanoyl-CoA dioxygenase family)